MNKFGVVGRCHYCRKELQPLILGHSSKSAAIYSETIYHELLMKRIFFSRKTWQV